MELHSLISKLQQIKQLCGDGEIVWIEFKYNQNKPSQKDGNIKLYLEGEKDVNWDVTGKIDDVIEDIGLGKVKTCKQIIGQDAA